MSSRRPGAWFSCLCLCGPTERGPAQVKGHHRNNTPGAGSHLCLMQIPGLCSGEKEAPRAAEACLALLLQASSGAAQPLAINSSPRPKQFPQAHLETPAKCHATLTGRPLVLCPIKSSRTSRCVKSCSQCRSHAGCTYQPLVSPKRLLKY